MASPDMNRRTLYFKSLSRDKQRANVLRRFNDVRLEIEQAMVDLQYWNDLQRSRGGKTIPEDPEMVRALAEIDQQIKHVRESL